MAAATPPHPSMASGSNPSCSQRSVKYPLRNPMDLSPDIVWTPAQVDPLSPEPLIGVSDQYAAWWYLLSFIRIDQDTLWDAEGGRVREELIEVGVHARCGVGELVLGITDVDVHPSRFKDEV
ncbi:MAG: hypothetical protein JJLCMIEE_03085 [Acidimicrobiales bacterium]|nr:hypothetical protein [Acidimicrobiales bacterium]